jgi:hypothetical protein
MVCDWPLPTGALINCPLIYQRLSCFAAMNPQPLYAAPGHSVCIISGYQPYYPGRLTCRTRMLMWRDTMLLIFLQF